LGCGLRRQDSFFSRKDLTGQPWDEPGHDEF
jgi:hypothetical protein